MYAEVLHIGMALVDVIPRARRKRAGHRGTTRQLLNEFEATDTAVYGYSTLHPD